MTGIIYEVEKLIRYNKYSKAAVEVSQLPFIFPADLDFILHYRTVKNYLQAKIIKTSAVRGYKKILAVSLINLN